MASTPPVLDQKTKSSRAHREGREDMIRVLIVDDHDFVRAMVAGVLNRADGILVVGHCADGADAPAIATALNPDVVLMDIRMPNSPGTVATRELLAKHPTISAVRTVAAGGTAWPADPTSTTSPPPHTTAHARDQPPRP